MIDCEKCHHPLRFVVRQGAADEQHACGACETGPCLPLRDLAYRSIPGATQ